MAQNTVFIGVPSAGIDSLSLQENKNNEDFPLVVEVSFEFGDLADFIIQVLRKYGLRHVAFLRDDAMGYFTLLSKGILRRFKSAEEKLYNNCAELPFISSKATSEDHKKVLIEADGRARGQSLQGFQVLVFSWNVARGGFREQ